MKDLISKGFSLGLGLAAASKEQVEKLVDELVKKGELTKSESNAFVNELLEKGDKLRTEIDEMIELRTKQLLRSLHVATEEEIEELRARIVQLEEQVSTLSSSKNLKE
ncbi:phasin family protein [Bacillus chungangensis]|uniref:Polyhydroxyalkanoate synthesis regulator phasin n=1 Tax=Bacillus chungangensis TaxID=587633 RepID=A0ABT9WVS2_9BACI|nr:polyhydroxyalkanoate synthesis regulator [Bacillus chungangensis]MDQ0177403.1 polyhydroxyalkanoate synthesis regulator phasin [Bacillus chungangensis]